MAGGFRNVIRNCRNFMGFLNRTPTFFARMNRNFVARKSAVGHTQLYYAVLKKNNGLTDFSYPSILIWLGNA